MKTKHGVHVLYLDRVNFEPPLRESSVVVVIAVIGVTLGCGVCVCLSVLWRVSCVCCVCDVVCLVSVVCVVTCAF